MSTTSELFEPIQIGPLRLRNRFIKSGANEAMCLDGAPTRALVRHHADLAHGGVAMTTVAYAAVSELGRTLPNQIWLRPEILPDLRVLTDAVHAGGAELHMGHGYLLNQFISPLDNRRRDEYGGSPANRVRFPASVLAAVKDAVGKDLAIIAKINVADGVRGGATADDGCVTAGALEAAGADMLVLSGGRNVESVWFTFGSPMNMEEMGKVVQGSPLTRLALKAGSMGTPADLAFHELYLLEYSRKIRAAVKMPLAYLGGVNSMDAATTALAEGFQCVVMARALIHDTALVNKFQSGELTRSGCTSCNRCVAYIYHPAGTRCVENPPNDLALNQQRAAAQ